MKESKTGTETLSDVDLHLYLAGALPPGKRLLMAWNVALDARLRSRLKALREETERFGQMEMPALKAKLFPVAATMAPARRAAFIKAGEAREDGSWKDWLPLGSRQWGYALAGSFAVLALCAVPFFGPPQGVDDHVYVAGEGPDAIAKGRGLGVTLYVKGDSSYKVEDHAARMSPQDTLQAIPLGNAAQQMVLLGWDARQGLVRLFPSDGSMSRQVSAAEPPPALLLQGMEENRLVCVTGSAPFRIQDAEALLRRKPFQPLDKAPRARLEKNLYVQIFAIAKTRPGRI